MMHLVNAVCGVRYAFSVANVTLDKLDISSEIGEPAVTATKIIIEYLHLVASFEKLSYQSGTNESAAACYQNTAQRVCSDRSVLRSRARILAPAKLAATNAR
jgi:hypothetical protein